jgi:hypothetical protein
MYVFYDQQELLGLTQTYDHSWMAVFLCHYATSQLEDYSAVLVLPSPNTVLQKWV